MMKTIHLTLIALCLFTFLSCDEDAFLDEQNPNTITTATFWKTTEQFDSALTTVYGALQFQSVSGGRLSHEMVLGDLGGTDSWYPQFPFRNLLFNDGIYHVTDKWNELYIGIFRANQVIQYIQDTEAIFESGEKENIEAQARFLRAFFYFQLVHSYSGGIMHTKVPETNNDLNKPLSSIEEITNSVIIPDLEFAIANLPEQWSDNNIGRATWGAATALLGKVQLYAENWPEAATLFSQVINSGIYELTPDIMDNFTHENEHNEESIFEVSYSAELNPGIDGNAVDDTPFASGAEASTLANAIGRLGFGGYNVVLSTYFLHELYTNDEVDPTNSINDGNIHSRRMTATIVPRDAEGLYYQIPVGEHVGWGGGQSAYVKKHTNWYHLEAEDNNSRSGINFRHIRLADVYLMYAEAVLNANSDVATAISYIDMVRTRAGVRTLQQYMDDNAGTFPQLHISIQVHGNQPYVEPSVETVMTHLRRVERPLELAFEGHRWKDLVRWGIAGEVLDELRQDEIWRAANTELLDIQGVGVAPLYIINMVRPDLYLSSSNYNAQQHDYFPIPASEVQTNDQLNNSNSGNDE
ncbi:MAG: RagB/SusD family nutrient uptake outer membrane protein [Bacteroidota bacterium]